MGKKVLSIRNFWGGITHRDNRGNKVGETYNSFWGGTKSEFDD